MYRTEYFLTVFASAAQKLNINPHGYKSIYRDVCWSRDFLFLSNLCLTVECRAGCGWGKYQENQLFLPFHLSEVLFTEAWTKLG